MPLPTFLVIGAQKCGTSSLHEYLALHPEIEMPATTKELDFFLADGDPDAYAANWRGDTDIRGEASPNYTNHPFHAGVPARAAKLVPGAGLVFLVRDPIQRVVSHYVHRRATHFERRSLPDVLADLPDNGIVHRSRYMWQLDRWLEHYPAEKVLVVVSERLRTDRLATLDRVFAFVGAQPGFRDDALDAEHYAGAERRELRGGPRIGRLLPRRPVPTPELPDELRARLAEILRPDAERLRAFTGDPIPEWSL